VDELYQTPRPRSTMFIGLQISFLLDKIRQD
jgi:hypothetical protein